MAAFEGDGAEGPDSVTIQASVADYVEYTRLLMKDDPGVGEEQALAYFRVNLEGWTAFRAALREPFSEAYKELTPTGLEDLTVRWVRLFADKFRLDWLEMLARYYRVSLSAPGCITRLRRELRAHTWLAQTIHI